MGFMDKLFGQKKEKAILILSPAEGEVVPVSMVSDPTFGEEILGKGVAIKPSRGRVVAPVNGTVEMMFDTGHAVSILSDEGTEILVHIGLDTVKLAGRHYTLHAKNGDKIKAGDLLMEFDMEAIQAEGYDIITPVVICNTAEYTKVETFTGKIVKELDEIISLEK